MIDVGLEASWLATLVSSTSLIGTQVCVVQREQKREQGEGRGSIQLPVRWTPAPSLSVLSYNTTRDPSLINPHGKSVREGRCAATHIRERSTERVKHVAAPPLSQPAAQLRTLPKVCLKCTC